MYKQRLIFEAVPHSQRTVYPADNQVGWSRAYKEMNTITSLFLSLTKMLITWNLSNSRTVNNGAGIWIPSISLSPETRDNGSYGSTATGNKRFIMPVMP